jgi:hypothetical protein
MSNELTDVQRRGALITFSEMESMASYIVRSKLFGAKDESQAMSLMLLAQAEGMHPMCAIQDFDIVQGRPARKTHSILARFQQAGGSVAWEEISATRASGTFSHKQGGSLRVEWTFEQAKKIGLTSKDNWKNYPQAMLRARCIAEGVRAVYPGAIGGMLSVEEAQDVVPQPPKDMGHADVVPVDVEPMIAAALQTTTDAEALAYWKANNKLLAKQPQDHKRLKEAIANHRIKLQSAEAQNVEDAKTVDVQATEAPPADDEFVAAMDAASGHGQ